MTPGDDMILRWVTQLGSFGVILYIIWWWTRTAGPAIQAEMAAQRGDFLEELAKQRELYAGQFAELAATIRDITHEMRWLQHHIECPHTDCEAHVEQRMASDMPPKRRVAL